MLLLLLQWLGGSSPGPGVIKQNLCLIGDASQGFEHLSGEGLWV